jgi:hypothetical protein
MFTDMTADNPVQILELHKLFLFNGKVLGFLPAA